MLTDDPEDKQKMARNKLDAMDVARFSVLLDAWIRSNTDFDKSMLTLSTGAIGLLVALLTAQAKKSSNIADIFVAGLVFFGISTILVLIVQKLTPRQISEVLKGGEERKTRPYEIVSAISFGLGIICLGIIGIHAAIC